MLPILDPVVRTYALDAFMLDRAVGDFLEADWAVRDAAGHDPRWIAGHLALYRQSVLALMGLPKAEEPWMACFARGKTAADVPADLDMGRVLASFKAAGEAMAGAWDGLSEEALAAPMGRTLPDGTSSVGDGLRFLAWHETYHLGQLGLFRKLAGKPGVA